MRYFCAAKIKTSITWFNVRLSKNRISAGVSPSFSANSSQSSRPTRKSIEICLKHIAICPWPFPLQISTEHSANVSVAKTLLNILFSLGTIFFFKKKKQHKGEYDFSFFYILFLSPLFPPPPALSFLWLFLFFLFQFLWNHLNCN